MNAQPLQDALLVLGMHRSGTSATSGALAKMGFELGPRLVEAAPDNPRGYFEHETVVAIHERFLESINRRWCDPSPIPSAAWHGADADDARDALRRTVMGDFATASCWALKDPRLSRLLPLWAPLWRDIPVSPRALIVVRHPGGVAASLARRDGFPRLLSDLLWLRHTLESLDSMQVMPAAVLSFDALLAAPDSALASVLVRLGFPVTAPQDGVLAGFLDPSMNHHASDVVAPVPANPVSRLAIEVYEALTGVENAVDSRAVATFQARFEGAWLDIATVFEAGAEAYRGIVPTLARWRQSAFAHKSEMEAQVQWSEAAVAEMQALRGRIEQLEVDAAESERVVKALQQDLALADRVAREREAERDALLVEREAKRDALRVERKEASERIAALRAELRDVYASRSWRWAAPLRWISDVLGDGNR
jgi:hypothetical protein